VAAVIDPRSSRTWPWPDVMGTLAIQRRWWHRLVRDRPEVGEAVAPRVREAALVLAGALDDLGHVPDAPCDGLGPLDLVEVRALSLLDALGGRRSQAPATDLAAEVATATTDRVVELMHTAGRLAVTTDPPPSDTGTIGRVSLGSGGVPKPSVRTATVDLGGMVGDRHDDRDNHGRPWQALCLWSAEVIDALAAEGHPISPGSCGENLTLTGLDWPEARPGVQVHLGPDVVAEISGEASPCRTIADSFLDRRFDRIDHDRHPGWSRVYAWVVSGGEIHPGDPVTLG